MRLLPPNRFYVGILLLDAHPTAALDYVRMDCWGIVCNAWTLEISENSLEFRGLSEFSKNQTAPCRILRGDIPGAVRILYTEIFRVTVYRSRKQLLLRNRALQVLRYTHSGRTSRTSILATPCIICVEELAPLMDIPMFRKFMLKAHSRGASWHDMNGRLCLHLALENTTS